MDLVGFDRAVFERIVAVLRAVCADVGVKSVRAIPVSALGGDNVVRRSAATPWWDGPALLEHLETVRVSDDRTQRSFRLPVQIVLRPSLAYRGFAGQIASGVVRTGDEIVALPSGKRTRVAAIDVHGEEVDEAVAPMAVALRLADEIDVSRGDMLVHASDPHPPVAARALVADLVWMNERPLDGRRAYLVKHTTRTVRAEIEAEAPLVLNDIARVRVRCHKPLLADPYARDRATGAFIVIDAVTNDTVAAGMIVEAHDDARLGSVAPVTDAERRRRLGQAGACVVLRGPEAPALAVALERTLFDRGRLVTVVPSANAAAACAHAGLVAIVAVVTPQAPAVEIDGHALDTSPGAAADAVAIADALDRVGLFD